MLKQTRTLTNCIRYANWINNPRIKALLPALSDQETQTLEGIRRKTAPKLLFLGPAAPTASTASTAPTTPKAAVNGLSVRMDQLFVPFALDAVTTALEWEAKVQMFTVAASTMVTRLTTQELFALALFTGEGNTSVHINQAISSEKYVATIVFVNLTLTLTLTDIGRLMCCEHKSGNCATR